MPTNTERRTTPNPYATNPDRQRPNVFLPSAPAAEATTADDLTPSFLRICEGCETSFWPTLQQVRQPATRYHSQRCRNAAKARRHRQNAPRKPLPIHPCDCGGDVVCLDQDGDPVCVTCGRYAVSTLRLSRPELPPLVGNRRESPASLLRHMVTDADGQSLRSPRKRRRPGRPWRDWQPQTNPVTVRFVDPRTLR